MMATTTIQELATLPEPGIIETLSFDAVFASIVQDFQGRYPDFTALLESDPAVKLLEVAAYRELLLRNRINEAARGQMLAFAAGTDLDHLGAFYGVERLSGEGDSALRRRIRLRIMGFSNAGGSDTYRYWALTSSAEIADVAVTSPQPGHVRISVLSRLGDGTASGELLDTVKAVVLRDDIRVLTDTVHVLGAEIVPVDVAAEVWLLSASRNTSLPTTAPTFAVSVTGLPRLRRRHSGRTGKKSPKGTPTGKIRRKTASCSSLKESRTRLSAFCSKAGASNGVRHATHGYGNGRTMPGLRRNSSRRLWRAWRKAWGKEKKYEYAQLRNRRIP
jgi:phage-related baseplate assembly protein